MRGIAKELLGFGGLSVSSTAARATRACATASGTRHPFGPCREMYLKQRTEAALDISRAMGKLEVTVLASYLCFKPYIGPKLGPSVFLRWWAP